MKQHNKIESILNSKDTFISNKHKTENIRPAKTEANETTLNMKKTIIHVKIVKNSGALKNGKTTLKAIKPPTVVATPLPPVNFKKMLQLWPQTVTTTVKIKTTFKAKFEKSDTPFNKAFTIKTGITPLSTSKII